ncbi:hypothetical protein Tco_0662591 [Tanacetum coccineum]
MIPRLQDRDCCYGGHLDNDIVSLKVSPKSIYLAAGAALAEYAISDDHPLTTFADFDGFFTVVSPPIPESQDLDAQTPRNGTELLTTKQPLISSYILKGRLEFISCRIWRSSSHRESFSQSLILDRDLDSLDLYHALMEALIADEDAINKEVKERVKDHKRKHDSDDDDDKGPSAGSNQGKSTKRIRHDSGASGSAQPPPKDDEQSSKKPQDFDASASKQHPTLTSTGWQITDTRDDVIDSLMHISFFSFNCSIYLLLSTSIVAFA